MKKKKSTSFSEPKLWLKLNKVAHRVGRKVVYPVVLLYYLFKNEQVPLRAKSMIVGALTYFILPLDGLPDFLPLLGYTDDLSLLIATLMQMRKYINQEILDKTHQRVHSWFKNEEDNLKAEKRFQKLLLGK